MQLNKKWLLLFFLAAPLLFVPPNNGNSQGSDSTTNKSNTDSLERAVTNFVKEVDKVENKANAVEIKLNENEQKAKEIDKLVNRLITKAGKPKIVVKKVIQKVPVYITVLDTSSAEAMPIYNLPKYGIEPEKKYWQPVSGVKKFFNRVFKKKNH